MPGISEKGNSGLFDNEIEFNGKYATMVRYLRDDIGLFTTFREAYVTSAIVGFINNCYNDKLDNEKVQPASIFPNELSKRKKDLRFIYRLIMLMKEEPDYTFDDYKNRAFRDDPEEHADILRENMKIFNTYACGGLEYIYNKFVNCNRLEDSINVLYDFVHEMSIDVGILEDDIELPDFNPEF